MKRPTMPASSGENDPYASRTMPVASLQPICLSAAATDAIRSKSASLSRPSTLALSVYHRWAIG